MGTRKLKIKRFWKNTFYGKSNGNLISQLEILIETSSTNISAPKIAYSYTPTFLNAQDQGLSMFPITLLQPKNVAQDQGLSNGMGV
jgi:hypothetical protein